jgi:hypothetical protein
MPTTSLQAASMRVAVALRFQSGLIQVDDPDFTACTASVTVSPAIAVMSPTFADFQLDDALMVAFQDRLTRLCPEPAVRSAVQGFPRLPVNLPVSAVVTMVQALIDNVPAWNGQCLDAGGLV